MGRILHVWVTTRQVVKKGRNRSNASVTDLAAQQGWSAEMAAKSRSHAPAARRLPHCAPDRHPAPDRLRAAVRSAARSADDRTSAAMSPASGWRCGISGRSIRSTGQDWVRAGPISRPAGGTARWEMPLSLWSSICCCATRTRISPTPTDRVEGDGDQAKPPIASISHLHPASTAGPAARRCRGHDDRPGTRPVVDPDLKVDVRPGTMPAKPRKLARIRTDRTSSGPTTHPDRPEGSRSARSWSRRIFRR